MAEGVPHTCTHAHTCMHMDTHAHTHVQKLKMAADMESYHVYHV